MQTAKQLASELWQQNQKLMPAAIQRAAEAVNDDTEFVNEAIREYSRLQSGASDFNSSMSRIWSERKRY